MKARVGFVSNSSSSSFLIYGCCIDNVERAVGEDKWNECVSSIITKYSCEEDSICTNEIIEEVLTKSGLYYHYDDCDHLYVGHSWDSVRDDETGKQFKDRTESEILKYFDKDEIRFGTIERSWYD